MTERKALLALGAHYDDCVFGVPGVMVQAARRGYRVVILTLIGDYSNFAPAKDRSAELRDGCIAISREYGAEMRFLDWKGHHFQHTTKRAQEVAQVVAEVRPDVALLLWPHDRHGDHVAASPICESALRHAGPLLDVEGFRPPARMYYYDNGPRHTVGFDPDTYVDVSGEWDAAREWLARFMALAYNSGGRGPADAQPDGARSGADGRGDAHPAVGLKETLAAYRGQTSGVRRAEALWSTNAYPRDVL
jgi:LmbE family N-acetylglucosaminyl deacetylase